ncbi:hypothetical protein DPMN_120523 [Dreissena polymorpha]|uniref:Uncharacterized protein n=1 Tax=Dreissena polymorpha TaxID=45954 RepID=A0A9D4JSS1_DREPO|nr:hypothetical protein DPMN_120523 [Dreissena polymorpha]
MEQYIRFPESRYELKIIADGFHQRCGMLGVVVAVDGIHSACPAPTSEHRSLFIRSLVLQAVCDSYLKVWTYALDGQVLCMMPMYIGTAQWRIKWKIFRMSTMFSRIQYTA